MSVEITKGANKKSHQPFRKTSDNVVSIQNANG